MINDFLFQWGPKTGGTIFSGFDGLGSVIQAAMYQENYNVFAFEKEERIWRACCDEVVKFGQNLDKKYQKIERSLEKSSSVQKLVLKALKAPQEITQEEVIVSFIHHLR